MLGGRFLRREAALGSLTRILTSARTDLGRLLDHVVAHAPEEGRVSMLENVRLYGDIVKAWASRDP